MPSVALAARRQLLGLAHAAPDDAFVARTVTADPAAAKGTSTGIFSDSFESAAAPDTLPPFAVRVLNKMAYGPRPGDVAAFNALGGNDDARLTAYVEQQLDPGLSDTDCDNRIAAGGFVTLAKSLAQLWSDHVRDRGNQGLDGYPYRYYPCAEPECAKLIRGVYSRRQLYEIVVDFWHNHFNVLGWDFNISPVFAHYDRDVIRPHAFGNFRQMLEEVAKSPAMLQYLDNKSSRSGGFNENFARELCELHTLGAENYYPGNNPFAVPDNDGDGLADGYCDNDVYEAARALTGWTMRDAHWEFPDTPEYDTGEFLYFADWHDIASKLFLRQFLPANQPAMKDARDIFDLLSRHPGTARHICRKLCRRFIADDPPQALVDSAAAIWRQHWQSPDQITRVLRHILTSDAFKSTWGEKVKRPWEAFLHALRGTGAEIAPRPFGEWWPYGSLFNILEQTGNRPYRWPTPDGYPDAGSKWTSVSTLAQTWRLMSWLTEYQPTDEPEDGDYLCNVVQVTNQVIAAGARTASAIVDFWIGRLFGYAIPSARRNAAIDFLRQNAAADAPLDTTRNDWNAGDLHRHYTQSRLRAAVALLLMTPELYRR